VHWCVGATIAKRFAKAYGLSADVPVHAPVLDNICEDPAHPFRIIGS
jgi:sugar (pentulose or hexulose) kinase